MKYSIYILIIILVLVSACTNQDTNDANHPMNSMMDNNRDRDDVMNDDDDKMMDDENTHMGGGMMRNSLDKTEFSTKISNLPDAKSSQVVEIKNGESIILEAYAVKKEIDGKKFKMLGYNGQIPGPLLKVEQGSEIFVEFTNKLDEDTTVHWHGLRLENEFDGVPDLTQETILPGKKFTYKLSFPDEGIYWYHPHVREDYQQELGLYGNILVVPKQKDYYETVNKEEFLILDDIYISDEEVYPFYTEFINNALMGRFGNIMLVNGQTDYKYTVNEGDVVRFYVTNVANTRTFNFKVPGAKMKLIGSDIGGYEHEDFVDSVIIAPAERYIVDVYFEKSGEYTLTHETPEKLYTLGKVLVSSTKSEQNNYKEFSTVHENPYVKEDINKFKQYFDKKPDAEIILDIDSPMGMMDEMQGSMNTMMGEDTHEGIEWEDEMPMMNKRMTNETITWILKDKKTGKENMDINYGWKIGDKVKLSIFNDPDSPHPMQHPIHFHGQRFLVLSVDGEKNTNLVWKDTVLVPTGSTIEILLDITNPGDWMAHCHIAEHLQTGMMTAFEVA